MFTDKETTLHNRLPKKRVLSLLQEIYDKDILDKDKQKAREKLLVFIDENINEQYNSGRPKPFKNINETADSLKAIVKKFGGHF